VAEFTFFVDAELYSFGGGELPAEWDDLAARGIELVEIPTGYGVELDERIPVRVVGSAEGLRFYAGLLGRIDPLQHDELDRVLAAAAAREAG